MIQYFVVKEDPMVLTFIKNYGAHVVSVLSLLIIASCAGISRTETAKVRSTSFNKNFKNSP